MCIPPTPVEETSSSTTSASTTKKFTISDVTSNNNHKSAYTLYRNKVLDITKFAKVHPGGDIILLVAGKDATVLVETYHPKGVPMRSINKLTIGTIEESQVPTSYYSWSSPFYNTLRKRVTQRLSELKKPLRGTKEIHFKAVLILFAFWFSLYQMYTNDTYYKACLWSCTMGVFGHFVGTCIQHDGNHGAFGKSKWMNLFGGWTMDMIGSSAFTWQFQHMLGHHPFTNLLTTSTPKNTALLESDPDVFSSYPFMRMHPTHASYWYHSYQHVYAPFLFALMTLAKVFQQDFEIISNKALYHIDAHCRYDDIKNVIRFWSMKFISMIYMCGLPIYFHGLFKGLGLFFIGHLVCGEVLATMFIVNHVIDGVAFVDYDGNDEIHPKTTNNVTPMEECQKDSKIKVPYNDWAAVQCQTSVNWSKGSWFWNHFSGGLSHQIEHHLFPSICHTNYVYIQDVVGDTCREFGVPYQNEKNLWTAYSKMILHLKIMGNNQDSKKEN